MPVPIYSLPIPGGRATKQTHDTEVNRCLSSLYAQAVTAQLSGPDAEEFVDDMTVIMNSIHDDAVETAENADIARQVLQPPIVLLCMGQSNMRSVSSQNTGWIPAPKEAVKFWNSQAAPMADGTDWVTGQLGQNPFVGGASVNNLAYQAAHELHRRTGRQVYVILAALGGHRIESFMNSVDLANNGWAQTPGQADLFTFIMAQAALALPLVPGAPTSVDAILMQQGEANKEDQVEVYANKARVMLKRFENNGLTVRNKTDIVFGELLVGANNGRYRVRHLSALERLQMGTRQDAFPRFKIARSTGLQPVTLIDDLHFSGSDLVALGKRHIDAMFTEQPVKVMDPTQIDMGVDSGLGWATSNVASTNNNTYDRREPFYLADTPFPIEDNAEIGWCYVAPANTTVYVATRQLFQASNSALLTVDLELRNDHPSNSATFQVTAHQFNRNLEYFNTASNHDITVPPATTMNISVTVGKNGLGADSGMSLLTRWFAVRFGSNPTGTGAAIKWNCFGMRWT